MTLQSMQDHYDGPTVAKRQSNLRRLFRPRSIVVIGASADPSKAGSQALQSLIRFSGKVMAVHPRERSIHGHPCYAQIKDLPYGIDLAILAIPARGCVEAAAQLAERGVGGVLIISGGFGESGGEGAQLQRDLDAVCKRTGLRLLGPNTSGFIAPHAPLVASFVPGVDTLAEGSVAVVAQSGGVNLSIAFLLQMLGEGVSLAAGLGNAIDVDSADLLEMLAEDPNTSAIALHLEGVPNGRRLYEVLRQVTPRKPVVALVAGKADVGAFAVSHTGNLLGSRQRTISALSQAGAIIVESTEELAQASVVLSRARLPPKASTNVALVTGQAGPGLLIADQLKSKGVGLPELASETVAVLSELLPKTFVYNPIDTGRPGASFPAVVEAAARDAGIDAVLVFALSEPAVLDPVSALQPAAALGKPVVFGTLGPLSDVEPTKNRLRETGIAFAVGPERLAIAATSLAADARAQALLAHSEKPTVSSQPLAGPLDEYSAKMLLASYGVRTPVGRLCRSYEEALAAFSTLRKPVVAKIAASDIAHKTEVGGVFVGISDEAQLANALDEIAKITTSGPGKILIEEMAGKGVELILGGLRDPSWGPMVMVGLGGVLAEALDDTAARVAPLSRATAHDMLDQLRGKELLYGFRDLPVADSEAVVDAILAVSRITCCHSNVAEIEINPLRAFADTALALDAFVRLEQ